MRQQYRNPSQIAFLKRADSDNGPRCRIGTLRVA